VLNLDEKTNNKNMNIKELTEKIIVKFKSEFKTIIPQLIAIFIALLVGAVVLLASGFSPIQAYGSLIIGAFGNINGIGQTLSQATPIVFTALAFLFAFKAGLFNIGAEGQLLMGAIAAAIVGISSNGLPSVLHIPLALLAGAFFGGLWALIPALLKTELGAHEVITTMMLSYVALYFTGYLVNDVFKEPGWVAQTPLIATSAELPRILPPTQLSASMIIGIILVGLTYYILKKTVLGYEIRAIGLNPLAAKSAGISVKKGLIIALVVSGALAGLGGAGEILGVHRRYIDGFSPGYGWDGLAVALIGGLDPIGALLASLLFGVLRSGGMTMNRVTGVPIDIITILQALIILFVAAPAVIKLLYKRGKKND
jgi:simple sugar transport system permease protein